MSFTKMTIGAYSKIHSRQILVMLWSVWAIGSTSVSAAGPAEDLLNAAKHGDMVIAQNILTDDPSLVSSRDNEGHAPLHLATAADEKAMVEFLLAHNADVNAKDSRGFTPLHNAAWSGYLEIAKLLIANNADVNARDNNGATPLHTASFTGHKDVAALLLANNADINAMDQRGFTPIHTAEWRGHRDVVALLREQGGHE